MCMYTEKSQTQNNMKNIFVDLDETLIHTNLAGKDYPNEVEEVKVNIASELGRKDIYPSSLRPGATKLLFALRETGQVYMLTRATEDYAVAMNKAFGLGFTVDRIYDRVFVKRFNIKPNIPSGNNYLIDDLPSYDNYEKIKFIEQLGPTKYIQIKAFYGFKEQAITSSMIAEIVEIIKKD